MRCFQAQTYPSLELIVLDNGSDRVNDLIADSIALDASAGTLTVKQIRYIPLKGMHTHGKLMNLVCMEAKGEFCIVTDDDDFYAPDRVMRQIAPLLAAPNYAISGLQNLMYYDAATKKAWRYSDPSNTWLGAIAFRRTAWGLKHFADLPAGADKQFQDQHKGKVIAVQGDAIACAIHSTNAGNVSSKVADNPKFFTPIEYQTVVDFCAGDL